MKLLILKDNEFDKLTIPLPDSFTQELYKERSTFQISGRPRAARMEDRTVNQTLSKTTIVKTMSRAQIGTASSRPAATDERRAANDR